MPGPIAVVGASAAGLYAAEQLARAGEQVTVVERCPSLQMAPRALIVTSRMLDVLGPAAAAVVTNQVRRFELVANGTAGAVELQRPDLVIERAALIEHLARRARSAGVRFELGARVADVEVAGRRFGLVLRRNGHEDRLEAATLIGADGARSRIAQRCGWPQQPTVPLIQAIVELPDDADPGTSRVWFRPSETPYFYWLIPCGEGRGVLGLIGTGRRDIRPVLDRFLEDQDLKPIEYQAAIIPAFRRWTPILRRHPAGDAYVVGDAAGQVKVSTVGGIVTGFRGAAAVVDSILGSGRRATRALRRELGAHLLIRRSLNGFSEDDYGALIRRLEGPGGRCVTHVSRDDALKLLWRFCRAHPTLAAQAARAALARS